MGERAECGLELTVGRRAFFATGLSLLLPGALGGCGIAEPPSAPGNRRLTAGPGTPTVAPELGESQLGLETGRDGLLFVPPDYDASAPPPLLVFLHGATGSAEHARGFGDAVIAGQLDAIVLVPESRGRTWDLMSGSFGPDVTFVDRALRHTFDRCAIDRSRVALAGVSDGATYALSLGVSNGDLFTHLIAFSPGGIDREETIGRPEVFISHGLVDGILPVQVSREVIVPELRDAGYAVEYHEFVGGHTVPNEIAQAAIDWFLGEPGGVELS